MRSPRQGGRATRPHEDDWYLLGPPLLLLFVPNPFYQGYLTATSSEDWTVVLDVCERASATEANAKEAAKALRREFKCTTCPLLLSYYHNLIQSLDMAMPHNNYQRQKCASQPCMSLIIHIALGLPPTPTLPPPPPCRSSQTSSTTQDLPLAHISTRSCSQSHAPTPIHSHESKTIRSADYVKHTLRDTSSGFRNLQNVVQRVGRTSSYGTRLNFLYINARN